MVIVDDADVTLSKSLVDAASVEPSGSFHKTLDMLRLVYPGKTDSHDVAALREHLLERGLADGATYCGQPGPNGGRHVVFGVAYPDYMPASEIRVADPDGYCLLVGQLG